MELIFSVIIPAYNVAGYIEKCLDSVLSQTWKEFEIIIVDDGSTDGTSSIIDDYARKDDRIKAIHKKNEGVSIARNTGIDMAKGKYFLFFDGDDFVEPDCMEELYRIVTDTGVDTVIYGYHRYEQGRIKETCYPTFEKDIYEGDEVLQIILPRFVGISGGNVKAWLRGTKNALYVENPALWRTMVSADMIRQNHIRFHQNLKVGEDTIFISEYLSYASRCYILRKCFYYLVTRETSTIYRYEKNPLAKLEGKLRLLEARNELTAMINQRVRYDLEQYWNGTVIMSCMELAFLLVKKNEKNGFIRRYRMFRSYLEQDTVQKIWKDFRPGAHGGIRLVPFLLMKWKFYMVLFLCAGILQHFNYEFQRG